MRAAFFTILLLGRHARVGQPDTGALWADGIRWDNNVMWRYGATPVIGITWVGGVTWDNNVTWS